MSKQKKYGGRGRRYELAICAVFKNEVAYLQEWIEYHKLIGVAHFYLYNNQSDDEYLAVLKKYILDGEVTVIDVLNETTQADVYKECILQHHQDIKWLAIIDIDEFICLKYDLSGELIYNKSKNANNAKSGPFFNQWLRQFEYFPALKFFWKQFGSSDLIERDLKRLVIEDFIFCEKDNIKFNHCKSILNMNYFDKFNFSDCHQPLVRLQLGPFHIKLMPFNVSGIFDYLAKRFRPVQINHYSTKSYNEFNKRKLPKLSLINIPQILSEEELIENINWININCTERDYYIMRFLPLLKKKINDQAR